MKRKTAEVKGEKERNSKQISLEEDKIKGMFNPKIWDKTFQDGLKFVQTAPDSVFQAI